MRVRAVALGVLAASLAAPARADRLEDFQGSFAFWALESQRRMAMDEPISNVMHVEGHNAYNTLAGDEFHVFPPAGPNQVLSMEAQLDAGARAVELDVHDLVSLEIEICQFDSAEDIGFRIVDLVAENLGVEVPFSASIEAAAPASTPPDPPAGTSFSAFGFGLGDIIDAIGGVFGGWLEDVLEVVAGAFELFGALATGDFIALFEAIVEVLEELELAEEPCKPLVGFCFPPVVVLGSPQVCGSPAGIPGVGSLFLGHSQGSAVVPVNGTRPFHEGLAEVARWLRAHPGEVVLVDLEDATGGNGDALRAALDEELVAADESSLVFTPSDRLALFGGRWPTRRELVGAGRRAVIFDSRDDGLRPYQRHERPDGHTWVGSSHAFRRNDFEGAASGNWLEARVQLYEPEDYAAERENSEQFFAVTGDGLPNGGQGNDPVRAEDVERMARNNVNVLKMDFLLGTDADDELVAAGMELPVGPPGARLARAVWSWEEDDPAAFRLRGDPDALAGGRDFAAQQPGGSRWRSLNAEGATEPLPPEAAAVHRYACRALASAGGEPDWRVTQGRGPWRDGNLHCRAEFGPYVFAGPVNGWRNARLEAERQAAAAWSEPVWLNVSDTAREGEWLVNLAPAAVLGASMASVDEGTRVTGSPDPDPGVTAPRAPALGVQSLRDGGGGVVVASLAEDGDVFRDTLAHLWSWSYHDPKQQGLPQSTGGVDVGDTVSPFPDDGTTTFTVDVTDFHLGGLDRAQVALGVVNVAPEGGLGTVVDDAGGSVPDEVPFVLQGTEATVTAEFSDRGVFDTHTASFDWGDGSATPQAELDVFADTVMGVGGRATARHVFTSAGEYRVALRVMDDDGGLGEASGTLRVASAAEAAAFVADQLAELLATLPLGAEARALVLEAIAWLEGRHGGVAANGASDHLGDDRSQAGLGALARALALLVEAGGLDAALGGPEAYARAVRLLALCGKSQAATLLAGATADRGDAERRVEEAGSLVVLGDALRAAGAYASALEQYALASRLVQGLQH